MTSRKPLAMILLVFLSLSGLYNWLVPPFEGPDGPEHFAYIEWLINQRNFPPQGKAAWDTAVRQEASQPPLYYLIASIPARLIGISEPPATYQPNPHFPSSAPGTIPDNKNVAIHYPADTQALQGSWLALYVARGISTCFGVLLIISVYNLAQLVMPKHPQTALLSAVLLTITPQVLFLSSIVSNDMAAAATCGWTLWLLARLLKKGPSTGRGIGLGLAFGLAGLSKTSTLVLGLPLAIGFAWLWVVQPQNRKVTVRSAIWAGGSTLVVAGWWYIRTWILYGTPLGLNTHYLAPWALGGENAAASRTAEWLEVFYSYFAAFGWGNIKFTAWVYWILMAIMLAAPVGISISGWRWLKQKRRLNPSILTLLLLALTTVAASAALERWMRQVTAPHGRLLFPALAAISVLLIIGWQKLHRLLPYLSITYLTGLTLFAPILLIYPAYSPPATVELANPSIGWQFGDIAELQSVTPMSRSVEAGEVLPIQVCWRPLARAKHDYSILVHLVGPNNQVVASRYTYPGLGSYPTSVWEPEKPFCDQILVDIPAELAQTLVYQVELGLIDYETMDRLPAHDGIGKPLSHTFVDQVRLSTPSSALPTPLPEGGSPIQLTEYHLSTLWRPGNSYQIDLVWQTTQPLDQDYTVFIHLRNRVRDSNLAQADGPPLDGWYPTSWWTAQEAIIDSHQFLLPNDIPRGRYNLVVGWYDSGTGEKLGEEIQLGQIEVQQ